jgi:hypothetical protein
MVTLTLSGRIRYQRTNSHIDPRAVRNAWQQRKFSDPRRLYPLRVTSKLTQRKLHRGRAERAG